MEQGMSDHGGRNQCSHRLEHRLPILLRRRQILKQYARHLGDADIAALAAASGGPARLSGRDLRSIAEQTERKWASEVGAHHPLFSQACMCPACPASGRPFRGLP